MSARRLPRLRHAFGTLADRVNWHPMTWQAMSARPVTRHDIQRICNPRFSSGMASGTVSSRVKWHPSGEQYLPGPHPRQTYTTAIEKLGGSVTTSVDDFTHLLTDTRLAMVRSKNVLCSLAAGGVSPERIVYRHTPPWYRGTQHINHIISRDPCGGWGLPDNARHVIHPMCRSVV